MDDREYNISGASRKVAFLGIMSSLSLVFGYFESLLPPIAFMPPGAKLGLGNILTMLTGRYIGLPGAIFVTLVKSGFVFLTRGVTAGLMSLAGGAVSCIVTTLLLRKSVVFGCTGIGMAGGLSHNLGQLAVAAALTSAGTFYYLPALLVFGCAAGAATGFALYYIDRAAGRFFNGEAIYDR